ncbi:ABC transporter permease [Desulfopila sp. IMCC35008]|uniref:ABC transporter permease n=1 Tax=Desulfopila sp. IMCC35008 TaxID=2653858 RepID=UPI0013D1D310|nr:ABC transporter permease subunit [Desulfopila sp. IMCC35008]
MQRSSLRAADSTAPGRQTPVRNLLVMLLPASIVIALLFGGGLLLGLFQALEQTPGNGYDSLSPNIFMKVLQDPDFIRNLLLTLYISTTSTLLAAIFSILLAVSFLRWSENSRILLFLLQIPLAVPHLVVAIAILFLLSPTGFFSRLLVSAGLVTSPTAFPLLVNDPLCFSIILVYIWKEIPFLTFMILSILKNSGPELLEAGATLKAGILQRFFYITLPLITPGLAGGCLIVFAFTFGAFEVPYLLGQTYPTSLPVWAYKSYSDIDLLARPEGIAIGLIIAAIVIGTVILAQTLLRINRNRGALS